MREDFEVNPRRSGKKSIIFAFAFIVIIGLIGIYVFSSSTKKETPIISPTPTPISTLIPVVTEAEVSPTSKSEITPYLTLPLRPSGSAGQATSDRSQFQITVLNGSGVAGSAKNISSYLSGLGYTIKTTGNAETYDYEGLTINVSKDKSSYLSMLKKDLAAKSSSISAQVVNSLTVDAEVIIGK